MVLHLNYTGLNLITTILIEEHQVKKYKMRIFIGHDTRYEDASSVCRQSIIENSSPNEHKITYLHKEKLKNAGVYGRADVEGESTEFSFQDFTHHLQLILQELLCFAIKTLYGYVIHQKY